MKRVIVLGDIQSPSHDAKAVAAITQLVSDYEPDELYCVGDEADSPEPSRWNKGRAEEYAKTLQKGLDTTSQIMEDFKKLSKSTDVDHKDNGGRRGSDGAKNLQALTHSKNVAKENKRRAKKTTKKATKKK